ncbi:MAG: GAF domain-containing protein [Bacteroidales bacterium]|nr:GAF domain-containing protein [Bacteroidales bacterium]
MKITLNTKILLFILSTSIIIFASAIGFISISLKNKAVKNATDLADIYAIEYANLAKSNMDKFMIAARTLVQTFDDFETISQEERRTVFMDIMVQLLKCNKDFISVWSIWEPNTIDTLDNYYINKPGSTFIGNFSPTYYKDNGEIKIELSTSTTLFQGDYYLIPKTSLQETILEPYYYSYTGQEEDGVLQTNMIVPIIVNNEFIGVVGVDVPLEIFQKLSDKIKPFKTGYALLISHNGLQVTHPDKKLIEKPFTDYFQNIGGKINIIEKIQNGENFSFFSKNKNTGDKFYISFAPVHIGNSPTPWSFAMVIPVNKIMQKANYTFRFSVFIGILGLLIITLVILIISRNISRPIFKTAKLIQNLAKGDIDTNKKLKNKSNDEIGEMTDSVNKLIDGLDSTAKFAAEIGKGNLNAEFQLLSDNDVLGNSLLGMRQSLIHAQEEEKKQKIEDDKQNWITQGLAKFGELLRQESKNMKEFTFNIIKSLTEYMDTCQGTFFILNDDDKKEIYFELYAAIAYGKRKLMKKNILFNENLIGRAAEEKATIYLKNTPDNYVFISPGLKTEKKPNNILIIPLNVSDEIYGAIELVSFNKFEKHHIEFAEKVSENIASTISSVKINAKTAELLEQSQKQADELSQQEEEMRQNLEEMLATQEESTKKETEMKGILKTIKSVSLFAEIDMEGKIISINNGFAKIFGIDKSQMTGKYFEIFLPKDIETKNEYENIRLNLRNGEVCTNIQKIIISKKEKWISQTFTPIFDDDIPYKVLNIATDITEEYRLNAEIKIIEKKLEDM